MKIVLAYSGGLDTSIIIPWLKIRYKDSTVICVCVNTGQEEDVTLLRTRAAQSGAAKLVVIDARAQFAEEYICPLLISGALYESQYFLGTAIARPLQAGHQARVALQENADALAHGCTGKGNDQMRFELAYKALAPTMQVIAPWRVWDIKSREDAIAYAQQHAIPLNGISKKNIYSRDGNLWHMSHEGGSLEDLTKTVPHDVYRTTIDPKHAPDNETDVEIAFKCGIPVAIDDRAHTPLSILETLNRLGAENGIGRVDMVESRIVGMKSRALYETPGGTILYHAFREVEAATMDGELRAIKRFLADRYAEIIYRGRWYSEQRTAIDAFMHSAATHLNGAVTLTLYKGNIITKTRAIHTGLYQQHVASFTSAGYEHALADGFIQLYGLSTALAAGRHTMEPPSHNYTMTEFKF